MRLVFMTVVWGNDYIDRFMSYAIPSLINNSNRIALDGQEYIIYTDKSGELIIKNYDSFNKLNSLCKVIFKGISGSSKQLRVMECVKDAVNISHNSFLYIIGPDSIYSPNSIKNSFNNLIEGYDACVMPIGALRVTYNFMKDYKSSFNLEEFMDLFFKHIHIETLQHYITSNQFIPNAVMYIKDGIAKSFYHQPVCFKVKNISDWNNLEVDLIKSLGLEKIYYFKSSDEFMFVNTTEEKYCGWSGIFNEEEFLKVNEYNINSISMDSFNSGFLIRTK